MSPVLRFLVPAAACLALLTSSRGQWLPWAPAQQPLTPSQIVKIGSWLHAHGVRTRIPDVVRLPMGLPVGPLLGLSLKDLNNRAMHELDLLPDGGLLLVVSNQDGSSIFRVDANLHLLSSLHVKNWVASPEPNPGADLGAEWAYWTDIANHTPY